MCGINGILSDNPATDHVVESMTSALRHRGPDDRGIWISPDRSIALGQQRLAVIDLSSAGAQPMHSSCNRYCIIYNGEIYNFAELRDDLKKSGIRFRSFSDTEVILESCVRYGVEKTLGLLVGMFAFALWDKEGRRLYLARDRLGIKPLYWGHFSGLFLFASELKSLRQHPGWEPVIDRRALVTFMRYGYIPAPATIYRGIYQLEPGSLLQIKAGESPRISRYWQVEDAVRRGIPKRGLCTESESMRSIEAAIEESVRCRMVADVPLGMFLSGGIDSSTVAALMQKNSNQPVKTFSVGFHEREFDEATHAAGIAKHLGTDHTQFYVSADESLEVIPLLADIYDEPFADSSQIPTYLLSKLTREHVTVALSGDGGDEVFAGYNRYYFAASLFEKINRLPPSVQRQLRRFIHTLSPAQWNRLVRLLPHRLSLPQAGDKLYKLAQILPVDRSQLYRQLTSHWQNPAELVINAVEQDDTVDKQLFPDNIGTLAEQMQFLDTINYLPNDILTKVDRASMAVSLEVRVPLLDHRVVEQAWALPLSMKLKNRQGKRVLREILKKYVPEELTSRPKSGFAVPLGDWLRGPLRDWTEDLLDEARIKQQGILRHEVVQKKWQEHLSGRRNWQHHLWTGLMFQALYTRWMQ